jgi:virginiamycin B lyase
MSRMREFPLPAGWAPYALATTEDDSVWMTLVAPGALARLAPDGEVTLHEIAGDAARPMLLTAGADGTLWYTRSDDRIGRVAADGAETLVETPAGAAPYGIGLSDDLWFTAPGRNQLGRLGPDGVPEMIDLPVPKAGPAMLTVASDGTVWTALNSAGALASYDGDQVRIIELPEGSAPVGIAAGNDLIWYADIAAGRVGFVDPSGRVETIALPDPACRPHAVAPDPAGGCWVTLWGTGRLAHVTAEGRVAQYALPGREPHGVLVHGSQVWVAMESGSLVAVDRHEDGNPGGVR